MSVKINCDKNSTGHEAGLKVTQSDHYKEQLDCQLACLAFILDVPLCDLWLEALIIFHS